jgi:hypothetical protein
MARIIKVQQSHSRNSHDFSLERDNTGRLCLSANGRGLKYRIGMVFAHLARNHGKLRAKEILSYLQKLDRSYQETDLSQVRNQLVKVGAIEFRGRGPESVWSITPAGRAIMQAAHFEWV